jgi:hypothetical protein
VGNTTNDVEIEASFAALGKDTKDCAFDNFPRTSPPLFLHHLKSVVELASSQFISPLLHFLFVAPQLFGLLVRSTPFNNIGTYTHLHTATHTYTHPFDLVPPEPGALSSLLHLDNKIVELQPAKCLPRKLEQASQPRISPRGRASSRHATPVNPCQTK